MRSHSAPPACHVFVAFPLPPAAVFSAVLVVRVIDSPSTVAVVVAWMTTVPAIGDVIWIEH